MEQFTKEDVLNRDDLPAIDGNINHRPPVVQGDWGENFFWHGEKCYIPVLYQGMKYKQRIFIRYRG